MAKQTTEDGDHLQLDSYKATIEPTDPSKREMLHQLAMTVFWPHRGRDIDLFLGLGQGYVACDEIGRPLASAMYFPMGDNFTMFGMMIVTPRLQAQGAGRRLLRRIMRENIGRDLRVTSPRSAFRLYESAGFVPVATMSQHQGVVKAFKAPAVPEGLTLRPMVAEDVTTFCEKDRHAYGADRSAMYAALMKVSQGVVLEEGGEMRAFAMMRNFGKGRVIGPVIAETEAQAMQVIAPLIQESVGTFTRLDTQIEGEGLKTLLAAAGMGVFDTLTEMRIGKTRRATEGPQIFGMASHSLG